MKTYKGTVFVSAAQIKGISSDGTLVFATGTSTLVDKKWHDKYRPEVGGYYVQPPFGDAYFSTQDDFEKMFQIHEVAQS